MTSSYSSRLARKQPTPDTTRYPTAAEVAAILRGKRQGNGSYLCTCPCRLHRRGDINPSLSVTNGRPSVCQAAIREALISRRR
jgi:hypothetical protein